MIRRHSRSSEQMHYGPALHTVTGNYVAGKRKGVVGGVDFGSTGLVSPASQLYSCNMPLCIKLPTHKLLVNGIQQLALRLLH